MDELYPQLVPLLWSTIHRFTRKTRSCWDREDMLSLANLAAVLAYQSYDPQRGKLSTHVVRHVWCALASESRRRSCDWQYVPLTRDVQKNKTSTFDLQTFLEDLPSDDTKLLVRLILDTPCDVRLFLQEGRETAKRIKRAVICALRQIGWTKKKITKQLRTVERNWELRT